MKLTLVLTALAAAAKDPDAVWTAAKADGGLCNRGDDAGYATVKGDCTNANAFCCYAWSDADPYWTSDFYTYQNVGTANTYCVDTATFKDSVTTPESTVKNLWMFEASVIQAKANGIKVELPTTYVDCNSAMSLVAGVSTAALAYAML